MVIAPLLVVVVNWACTEKGKAAKNIVPTRRHRIRRHRGFIIRAGTGFNLSGSHANKAPFQTQGWKPPHYWNERASRCLLLLACPPESVPIPLLTIHPLEHSACKSFARHPQDPRLCKA